MKFLHISDWHADAESFKVALDREIREDPRMLEANVVILSGDMVFDPPRFKKSEGLVGQIQKNAFDQMVDYIDVVMPGVDIVGVRGNHDYFNYGIQGDSWQAVESFDLLGYKWASMRGVVYHTGYWNDELMEGELNALCKQIPEDTQILVSHAPPFGILDDSRDDAVNPRNLGSQAIRLLVDRLPNLQLHMYGHIHEQGCQVQVRKNAVFSNASCGANFIVLPLAS